MCKALNSNAISELSDEYHVRTCRRDELDIWKEMPFDDMKSAKEYNGFMTEYFNDVYGSKEDLLFQKCLFVCDKNDIAFSPLNTQSALMPMVFSVWHTGLCHSRRAAAAG